VCLNLLFASCTGGQTKKKIFEEDLTASEVDEIVEDQSLIEELKTDGPTINIRQNQTVETGTNIIVNSQGKWFGFEAELGTVELLNNQGQQLGLCILSTTENWMVQGPVNYNCTLEYNSSDGGTGKLVVKNNNPSGEVEHDKAFEIPISYLANP